MITVKKGEMKSILHSKDPKCLVKFYLEGVSPKDCTTWGRVRDFALLGIQTRLLNVLDFYAAENFVY